MWGLNYMWPFNILTETAQVAILTAVLTLVSSLAGYTYKGWLDRREYERRHKEELKRTGLVLGATLREIEKYNDPRHFPEFHSGGVKPSVGESDHRKGKKILIPAAVMPAVGAILFSILFLIIEYPQNIVYLIPYAILLIFLILAFILGIKIRVWRKK
jgi:hypothetical protein